MSAKKKMFMLSLGLLNFNCNKSFVALCTIWVKRKTIQVKYVNSRPQKNPYQSPVSVAFDRNFMFSIIFRKQRSGFLYRLEIFYKMWNVKVKIWICAIWYWKSHKGFLIIHCVNLIVGPIIPIEMKMFQLTHPLSYICMLKIEYKSLLYSKVKGLHLFSRDISLPLGFLSRKSSLLDAN